MPTELTGEDLLDYYREAVRAEYGSGVADRCMLQCENGWYHQKLPILNGRVDAKGACMSGYTNESVAYRAGEFREMADGLLKRAKEEL